MSERSDNPPLPWLRANRDSVDKQSIGPTLVGGYLLPFTVGQKQQQQRLGRCAVQCNRQIDDTELWVDAKREDKRIRKIDNDKDESFSAIIADILAN